MATTRKEDAPPDGAVAELCSRRPSAAAGDPRALLVWAPFAIIARKVFPDEFNELDQASGGRFRLPGNISVGARAMAADWLAWEQRHDSDYSSRPPRQRIDHRSGAPATLVRASRCDRTQSPSSINAATANTSR
jgi:hypothetical protein